MRIGAAGNDRGGIIGTVGAAGIGTRGTVGTVGTAGIISIIGTVGIAGRGIGWVSSSARVRGITWVTDES